MSLLPGVWPCAPGWDQTSCDPEVAEDMRLDPQRTFEWTKMLHYGLLKDLCAIDSDEIDHEGPCSVCHEPTLQTCEACGVDFRRIFFVCSNGACMDEHELDCVEGA